MFKRIAVPNINDRFFSSPHNLWIVQIITYLIRDHAYEELSSLRTTSIVFKDAVDLALNPRQSHITPLKILSNPDLMNNPCLYHHLHRQISLSNARSGVLKLYQNVEKGQLFILARLAQMTVFFSIPIRSLDTPQESDDLEIISATNPTAENSIQKSYKTHTQQFCQKFTHTKAQELAHYLEKVRQWMNAPANLRKLIRLLCFKLLTEESNSALLQDFIAELSPYREEEHTGAPLNFVLDQRQDSSKSLDIYTQVISAVSRKAIEENDFRALHKYLLRLPIKTTLSLLKLVCDKPIQKETDLRLVLESINRLLDIRAHKKFHQKLHHLKLRLSQTLKSIPEESAI